MAGSLLCVVSFCCCLWLVNARRDGQSYFTAAVFKHRRLGSPEYDSANAIIHSNLDYYSRAAEIARFKGSDVIVFPEYGIFPPGNRTQVKKFLEYIPDPQSGGINPCEEPHNYADRPIIYTLSCIALHNHIVVVANTGDIQDCTGEDECPPDGVFHFNTNVVFDRGGTMILKYHKEHLFFEIGMDPARKRQNTIFHTDFGTFATYISFDIVSQRMVEVGRKPGLDAILLPTWWKGAFPQFVSVEQWQSWALGNNVTLLAANAHSPGLFAVGSGIFHGESGALAYTFNPDGISKLIVAKVQRKGFEYVSPKPSITAIEGTEIWSIKNDGDEVPSECSKTLLNYATDIYRGYRSLEGNMENYTFVKLTDPSGRVEACNNGMCCSLDYTTSGGFGVENFHLAVFNGTYNALGGYSWCQEECVLVRCDAHEGVPCAIFPLKATTVFQDVYMRAKFSTDIVYPQVVGSRRRLVPLTDWRRYPEDSDHLRHHMRLLFEDSDDLPYQMGPHFGNPHPHSRYEIGERSVHFKRKSGRRLISLGMKGRCYERDPQRDYPRSTRWYRFGSINVLPRRPDTFSLERQ